jgi:hypothetical protein
MSVLINSQPENTNNIQTTRHKMTFLRLPHMVYFCQSVYLPSISLGDIIVENPFLPTHHAGEKLIFEPLTLTFIIDEDLRAWEEIYNWMKGLGFPNKFDQYKQLKERGIGPLGTVFPAKGSENLYTDCTLHLYTNSHVKNFDIVFHDAYPSLLGPINFTATDESVVTLTTDVTIQYDWFEFKRPEST